MEDRAQEGAAATSGNAWRRTSRRRVLGFVGVCISGFISGVRIALAQSKKLALGLDKAEKLKSPGGSVLLKIQGRELLFIRDSQESVRVLNPVCSHQKCTVQYDKEKQLIVCPCHGSTYSLDGQVVKGPAEKALQAFDAALDGQNNRIIFSAE